MNGNMLTATLIAAGLLTACGQQQPVASSSTGIQPAQIQLDTQGLPYSWQPVLVPATPYNASQPAAPTGLPQHIQILFGATTAADRKPDTPIIYIIPVDAYKQIWDDAGNHAVSTAIDNVFKYTAILPDPVPTGSMPALPPEEVGGGSNDLATQVNRILIYDAGATKNGYRFVGRWAQDPSPVTNQGLRYVYQGFTNDARYLVSFFYPVMSPALPADASNVPAAELAELNADPTAYLASKAAMLDSLPPEQWEPDLAKLDALVASIQIEGMPENSLIGHIWKWTAQASADAAPEPVDKPELYQITYQTNGILNLKADCNTGSGAYSIGALGGILGSIVVDRGPITMTDCGPQSRYVEFANAVKAAQTYQVQPGGARMELQMPAGGPRLRFDLVGSGAPTAP